MVVVGSVADSDKFVVGKTDEVAADTAACSEAMESM
jgi:hypothetical protein